MKVDLDILEKEQLIGKLKLLEFQNATSPFRNANEKNVERRLSQALKKIPDEFHQAALSIFGSVLYINENMLNDCWKYLWNTLINKHKCSMQNIWLLELDRDQLRDEFYRANQISGRLEDNLPWRSSHDIIDMLNNLEENTYSDILLDKFKSLVSRDIWVVLVDISISGSSVISEINRIQKLASLLRGAEKPKIIALVQIITEEAIVKLQDTGHNFLYGLKIPNSCAFNSEKYDLIKDSGLKIKAKELCIWFADTFILPYENRLAKLAKSDKNIAYFGFGGMGWNIVTHKNTPNNFICAMRLKTLAWSRIRPSCAKR